MLKFGKLEKNGLMQENSTQSLRSLFRNFSSIAQLFNLRQIFGKLKKMTQCRKTLHKVLGDFRNFSGTAHFFKLLPKLRKLKKWPDTGKLYKKAQETSSKLLQYGLTFELLLKFGKLEKMTRCRKTLHKVSGDFFNTFPVWLNF